MSSVDANDVSCSQLANDMSCKAMSLLAKEETIKNGAMLTYNAAHPAHARYCQQADRQVEYEVQANGALSRNMCLPPATFRNIESQPRIGTYGLLEFKDTRDIPARFDLWTRFR